MSEQMLSLHCRTQSGGSKALASLFPLGCARGHYEEEKMGYFSSVQNQGHRTDHE